MQQPQQYSLKLDTPSANRLILNNLGIAQPPQQNNKPSSTPRQPSSFPSLAFYQSAFRPIHPDQSHASPAPTKSLFSPQHSQPLVDPQSNSTSNVLNASLHISPPIIYPSQQPTNTAKPSTPLRIPDTVGLYNNAPSTLKHTKPGLELKNSWQAHPNPIVSISHNSTRNQFISVTGEEMSVWAEPGKALNKIKFPMDASTCDLNPWSEILIVGGVSKRRSTISFSRCRIKDGEWTLLETTEKRKSKRVKGVTALYEDEMIFGDNNFVVGEVDVDSNLGFVLQYNGETNQFRNPVHSWNVQATPHTLRKRTNSENQFFVATLSCTMMMFDTRSSEIAINFGKEHLGKKSVRGVVHCMDTVPDGLYTAGTDNCLSFYDVRNAGEPIQVLL
eukprot:Phypoly_transcript_07301.p1 GENE.Phypoly_transcript_07301~~Phypoly_transcript_07301.p1  ORF type:complete len:388 (+),score=39.94 Phypoly_transcript_07301:168-1331(+)